jgi:tetratricopeptide (TPR) repeat protein
MSEIRMKVLSTLAATAALALFAASPALSAGEESGDQPAKTKTSTECTDGKVWDEAKKECVEPDKSGFNDSDLYKAARELAYAGQYDNAIRVLKVAKNQNDPRILNYMGFANRKAGRVEIGMAYYRKAIAADANYLLARSYMGQGLILQGDIEGAREQLVEIRDRGGKDTYAYRTLYEALKQGATY